MQVGKAFDRLAELIEPPLSACNRGESAVGPVGAVRPANTGIGASFSLPCVPARVG